MQVKGAQPPSIKCPSPNGGGVGVGAILKSPSFCNKM